jgi:hypothetical protein
LFRARQNTVRPIRQKFARLVSKGKLDDPDFDLASATIGIDRPNIDFPGSEPAGIIDGARAPGEAGSG